MNMKHLASMAQAEQERQAFRNYSRIEHGYEDTLDSKPRAWTSNGFGGFGTFAFKEGW